MHFSLIHAKIRRRVIERERDRSSEGVLRTKALRRRTTPREIMVSKKPLRWAVLRFARENMQRSLCNVIISQQNLEFSEIKNILSKWKKGIPF